MPGSQLWASGDAYEPYVGRWSRLVAGPFVDWLDVPAGALVRPKDPREFARKLRFHQKVKSSRDYGVMEP